MPVFVANQKQTGFGDILTRSPARHEPGRNADCPEQYSCRWTEILAV